jgi:hypothetical protein
MKMKMRTIKTIVNSTATSRAAISLSTWVDIAVTIVESLKVDDIEYCGINRAATITYWVAGGLVVWQDCLNSSHEEDDPDRKEDTEDNSKVITKMMSAKWTKSTYY